MRLLLDTHVVIWLFAEPARIPSDVLEAIRVTAEVGVSVVSAWEHELKRAKRPDLALPSFETVFAGSGFQRLDLPFAAHVHAHDLPAIHGDPFDRMLVAHALVAGAILVTADQVVRSYPAETLW